MRPLLAGEMRSCFAMTEPAVASSDATNIQSSIVRDGDSYVVNGHKWWISGMFTADIHLFCTTGNFRGRIMQPTNILVSPPGAMDPRCKICIFMGKTDPDAPRHEQQVHTSHHTASLLSLA